MKAAAGGIEVMLSLNGGFWSTVAAVAVIAFGAQLAWRGVRGSRAGDQGLLRSRSGMLGRLHGFRLAIFGLTLIGGGVAVLLRQQWLLLLAIGIGVVEILESSALIAFWGQDRPQPATSSRRGRPPSPGSDGRLPPPVEGARGRGGKG
jgi:hypothetical protein